MIPHTCALDAPACCLRLCSPVKRTALFLSGTSLFSQVRSEARHCFRLYCRLWPERESSLRGCFDPSVLKVGRFTAQGLAQKLFMCPILKAATACVASAHLRSPHLVQSSSVGCLVLLGVQCRFWLTRTKPWHTPAGRSRSSIASIRRPARKATLPEALSPPNVPGPLSPFSPRGQ